ncbi:uncharacterized protein DNG_06415 [Cephalotrichum gorgonifer]|uniref:Uncharacterized protein n=1 Tax=Cephalotrichum gorgonifer TaxID=2041049 RepID=A0AAE8N2R3_9PEZI|nr:uncharacterized protein DNG_06415 [Cephalotrichum gorgonifer]
MRFPPALSCLLFLQGTLAWESTFNATENRRPLNVTGLNLDAYKYTGSYYNGTLTYKLDLKDRNYDADHMDGPICGDFINKTITVEHDALVGVLKKSPSARGKNPVEVEMWGWDKGFDFVPTGTKNYSEFQQFHVYTGATGLEDDVTKYALNVSLVRDFSYDLYGKHAIDYDNLMPTELNFNFTDQCKGDSVVPLRDIDYYLFAGGLITPTPQDLDFYSRWADDIPQPTIEVYFSETDCRITIRGLFSVRAKDTELVGEITISFEGAADKLRSDQLLLGLEIPEWNNTLGFSVDSVLEGDDDSGSARWLSGWSTLLTSLSVGMLLVWV